MKKKNVAILAVIIVIAIIVVLAVMFSIKTYSVSFDTQGGTTIAAEKVKVFKRATRPTDPTKDGYIFDNWYYNDGIFDFDTRITKDMILEARWIDDGSMKDGIYTVSFNSNGGSSVASLKTDESGLIIRPEDPTREGYKFVAWQYNGEDFDFQTKITSNMTLVAKWEEEGTALPSVPAEKVTLSPTNINLKVGNTRRINVTLSPKEATNRTMTWITSNNRVATVDRNGTVRAVGVGKATITVEVDGIKASVTVNVSQATNPGGNDPTPEPPVTYSVEIRDVAESAVGQVKIFVKSSKGQYVAGVVKLTLVGGGTKEITVPASGTTDMYIKSVIENAEFVRLS